MKVKVLDLYEAFPSIQKIANLDLPFKKSYKISKLLKSISSEMKIIEDKRSAILKKYHIVSNISEATDVKAFEKEIKEFNEFEISFKEEPIDLDIFESEEDVKISPKDLIVLEPFFTFSE